jgi:hypothetical protein
MLLEKSKNYSSEIREFDRNQEKNILYLNKNYISEISSAYKVKQLCFTLQIIEMKINKFSTFLIFFRCFMKATPVVLRSIVLIFSR